MGRRPATELSEKHWKALRMFEEGGHSRQEIAKAIELNYDSLSELIRGDIHNAGQIADLFKKEWLKIEEKRDENIKSLVKENTEDVQFLIKKVVTELKSKDILTGEEKKLLNMYNNSLNNSVPAVSIKNLSYSYTQGLTVEDLLHEFTRLKNIAESSFNRRRVQDPGETGPGSLSAGDEPGS